MNGHNGNAVVIFSGGQDSTTCLFWAKRMYARVRAVSFFYNQRHALELDAAAEIAKMADVPHEVIRIDGLHGGALTEHGTDVKTEGGFGGLPTTFLPARNLVFLSLAASVACRFQDEFGFVADLVTGVCQTDYSGYPDCRRDTMDAMQSALALGLFPERGADDTGKWPIIQTPLMSLTKSETCALMTTFGPVAWAALSRSVTCYEGKRPGCGACPACVLRAKGFAEAGLVDPTFPRVG